MLNPKKQANIKSLNKNSPYTQKRKFEVFIVTVAVKWLRCACVCVFIPLTTTVWHEPLFQA